MKINNVWCFFAAADQLLSINFPKLNVQKIELRANFKKAHRKKTKIKINVNYLIKLYFFP